MSTTVPVGEVNSRARPSALPVAAARNAPRCLQKRTACQYFPQSDATPWKVGGSIMAKRSVVTEQDGRVYRIVLSKPRAGNAIDMAMAEGLGDAVRSVPPDIGCVLIAAEGANFCVGGDVDS